MLVSLFVRHQEFLVTIWLSVWQQGNLVWCSWLYHQVVKILKSPNKIEVVRKLLISRRKYTFMLFPIFQKFMRIKYDICPNILRSALFFYKFVMTVLLSREMSVSSK